MATPKVSVLIPVYNTQQYLPDCVDSIRSQTLSDVEILLIDDGSSEECGRLCRELSREDDRIRYYKKEHEGAGAARNFGIAHATGEYLLFLDSDDWMREDAAALLVGKAEREQADMVLFDFVIYDAESGCMRQSYENRQYRNCDNLFDAKMCQCLLPSACTALYRTEVWKREELWFPVTPFEDNGIYPLLLLAFPRWTLVAEGLYFYRTNYGKSATKNIANDKRRKAPFLCLIKTMQEKKIWEQHREAIYDFCVHQLQVSLEHIRTRCDKETYQETLEDFCGFLTEYFPEYPSFPQEEEDFFDVSVIVPVHNSGAYLEECLDSLCGQRYGKFEVLCIDDNSTDQSLSVIDRYRSRDRRFRLIEDTNGSYGHKINVGIREASGRYITILESDDLYADDMLECLHSAIVNTHADYVDANFSEFFTVGSAKQYTYCSKYNRADQYNRVIYGNENRELLLSATAAIWSGMYRKEFLLQNRIRLNESAGASYQDVSFRFLVTCLAETSYHLPNSLYCYRVDNRNSSVKDDTKVVNIVSEYQYLKNELFKRGLFAWRIKHYYFYWKYEGFFWNFKRLSLEANRIFVPCLLKETERDKGDLRTCWEELRPPVYQMIQRICQNPQAVWEEEKQKEAHQQEERGHFLHYRLFVQRKKAIIFGAGKMGQRLLSGLLQERSRILYFCDNDAAKWGRYVDGIEIVSPRSAVDTEDMLHYIIANKHHHQEIRQQLMLLGVQEQCIEVYS